MRKKANNFGRFYVLAKKNPAIDKESIVLQFTDGNTSAEDIVSEATGGANINSWFVDQVMDDVSDNMLPQVSNLLPKIDSILTQVNRLLANQNIPTAMEELRKTSENLSVATAHLKTFAGEDLPKLSQRMDRIGANVETVTGKLSELEFAETMDKVNTTMANVEQMTTRLTSRDNTIGLMLNDDSLYTNLNRTASNASLLLQDLREHPKRYVHFSLFGRKDK